MNHTDNSGCVPYLKALSDETRWEIMRVVANAPEPPTLGQVARSLDLSDYNASRHVRILSEAGLVRVVRDGRFKRISVAPEWLSNWQNGKKGQKADAAGKLDLGCCSFDFTEAKPGHP